MVTKSNKIKDDLGAASSKSIDSVDKCSAFKWSFQPILFILRSFGIELDCSILKHSTRSIAILSFGGFMIILNVIANTTTFLSHTNEILIINSGKNTTGFGQYRSMAEKANKAIFTIGIQVSFFIITALTTYWEELWNNLKNIQDSFKSCLNNKFYAGMRKKSLIGILYFFFVSFRIIIKFTRW